MRMRAFLAGSRYGRAICVLLLALFLVLCGFHVATAGHDGHDGHADGLVTEGLVLVALVVVIALLITRVHTTLVGRSLRPSSCSNDPPRRPLTVALVLEAPLRC